MKDLCRNCRGPIKYLPRQKCWTHILEEDETEYFCMSLHAEPSGSPVAVPSRGSETQDATPSNPVIDSRRVTGRI